MTPNIEKELAETKKKLKQTQANLVEIEEKFTRIIKNSQPIIFVIDKDGIFTLSEGASLSALGLVPGQIVGMSAYEVYKDFPEIIKGIQTALNGKLGQDMINVGENYFDIFFSPYLLSDGSVGGLIGMAIDITKQIKIRNAFKRAKLEAEQANKAKSIFVANVSHELRTPIHLISGYITEIKNSKLTEDQFNYINIIEIANKNLKTIIEDILDLSIIERGELIVKNEKFNIFEILDFIYRPLRQTAVEKGLELDLNIDQSIPLLVGDSIRFGQIIRNLLDNAIKYTINGSITTEIKLEDQTDGTCALNILIKDTGIGIPEENQDIVWNSFYKGTSSHTGFGLGLPIVKDLTKILNGSISLESKLGQGTSFLLKFEFKKFVDNSDLILKEDKLKIQIDHKLKLLLVDDFIDNLDLLKIYVKNQNIESIFAMNGEEAVKLFQSQSFDQVYLDIRMPIMDGFEAVKKMREWEKKNNLSRTKIIALTAYYQESNLKEDNMYFCAGFDDVLTKPLNKNGFLSAIKNYLKTDPDMSFNNAHN